MTRGIPFRPAVRLAAVTLVAAGLAACGSVRETIGVESEPPDEYQVVVRAPLSMPKEYGLPAPKPGASRPQEQATRDRTKQIVLDAQGQAKVKTVKPEDIKGVSRAEAVLLSKFGADGTDPNIRQVVERETTTIEAGSQTFVESLLFWKKNETPSPVVDPVAERKRLQENAALGKSTDSGATPEIQRKKSKTLLETLF